MLTSLASYSFTLGETMQTPALDILRTKTAFWPGAEEREFNRSHNFLGKSTGGFLGSGGMPIGNAIVGLGLHNGANEAAGFKGFEGSTPEERNRALTAQNASGFGSGFNGALPIPAMALLGAGAGALIGGQLEGDIPESAMLGAMGGSVAGTVPAYYHSKAIGRHNALEALAQR